MGASDAQAVAEALGSAAPVSLKDALRPELDVGLPSSPGFSA
jgi:hypothetical protein